MASKSDEEKGRQLLSAVERLVSDNAVLRAEIAACETRAKARLGEGSHSRDAVRELVAQELTRTYSNRAAIAGGASALPALLPGLGSLAAVVTGTFAELAYVLKTEVELCLSIAHVYGFDIDDPRERQLAFLLAAVGTYDAGGKNFFVDVVRAEGVALWNYGPRVITRMVIQAMTAVALMYVWRGFIKMVPVLGIAIGGGLNKVLSQRVGARAARDFKMRRELMRQEPTAPKGKRVTPPRAAKATKPAKKKPERPRTKKKPEQPAEFDA
ncbi:MAG: EcsC family protein [Myxococcaceae bacterium]